MGLNALRPKPEYSILIIKKFFILGIRLRPVQSALLAVLIISLVVQTGLAVFTAKDAHSRGHDRLFWFVLVLLFGLLSVIFYLLIRNDDRVSASERRSKRDFKSHSGTVGYFTVGAIVGLILFTIIGTVVAEAAYPKPETNCTTETTEIGGDEVVLTSCEDGDHEAILENRQKRGTLRNIFSILGLLAGGVGILPIKDHSPVELFSS